MSTNLLERLSNAIATAVNPTAKNMTRDEFTTYATEQIVAIASDKDPEVAKARLAALDKARTEAKKFDEHSTVRISIFDPAQLVAEHSETTKDPVASGDREDSAPEAGLGEEAGKTSTTKAKTNVAKSLSEVVVDLDAILNPPTAEQLAAKAEADRKAEEEKKKAEAEAGKQFGAGGGGGGGGGATDDEDEEEEEEEDVEAGKGEEVVDESDPNNLFPLDMNEQRFDSKKGKLVRKSRVWGDDPAEVRGVS